MSEVRLTAYSEQEIAHCKASMSKPAPMDALRLIGSGRVLIELSPDGRDVYIVEIDGKRVVDPDYPRDASRRCGLAGAWPLYRAGMIDAYGVITEAGRSALERQGGG